MKNFSLIIVFLLFATSLHAQRYIKGWDYLKANGIIVNDTIRPSKSVLNDILKFDGSIYVNVPFVDLSDSITTLRAAILVNSAAVALNTAKDTTGIYHSNRTALDLVSGTNTGDQDISALATKTALTDSTAQVRSEIPDVSGFLTEETDPVYLASEAANIIATDITNLSNLSGTNTGDQDLSSYATTAALSNYQPILVYKNSIELGQSNTGDRSVFIDLHSDDTYTDFGLRLFRYAGENGAGGIIHRGTGNLQLYAQDGADIVLLTTGIVSATNLDVDNYYQDGTPIDFGGYLTSETDPVYLASEAANIIATDITNLSNLSGTNTGDQTLSEVLTQGNNASEQDMEVNVVTADSLRLGTTNSDYRVNIKGGINADSIFVGGIRLTLDNNDVSIGDYYQGGIVFYIHSSGSYGYCATESEIYLGNDLDYSLTSTATGATGETIGTGQGNTDSIIAVDGSGVYAAYNCDNLTLNGYSDWFLPSVDELDSVYNVLHATGLNTYAENYHWSSTELTSAIAWTVSFISGSVDGGYKNLGFPVIAIRKFVVTGEFQTLSISSYDLSISDGNTVNLEGIASGITELTGDITANGTGSVAATIATDAVDISMLSATGTASSSTYLRGDNTWTEISGGGGTVTSVGLSSSDLSISGSPITSSGAIIANLASSSVDAINLNNNVISGQTKLTSGLVSTDELLVSDGGTIKGMDASVLQTYMQDNLTFSSTAYSAGSLLDLSGTTFNVDLSEATSDDTFASTDELIYISGTTQKRGTVLWYNDTYGVRIDNNIGINEASYPGIDLITGEITADIIRGTYTYADSYKLNGLNTAPTSATDTGTTGDIRITATYIYICTATNTWRRTAIETW